MSETLTRKPSTDAAAEQKPTPIKPGYWRNKWRSRVQIFLHTREAPGVVIATSGPGEFLTKSKFPTAEIAEQRALENLKHHEAQALKKGIRYLGPVFFPEKPSP